MSTKPALEYLPERLRNKSLSVREIVLEYSEALEALDFFHETHIPILGYEGLIHAPDGTLTHAEAHQGTADGLPFELLKEKMRLDHDDWSSHAVADHSSLVFCITIDTSNIAA